MQRALLFMALGLMLIALTPAMVLAQHLPLVVAGTRVRVGLGTFVTMVAAVPVVASATLWGAVSPGQRWADTPLGRDEQECSAADRGAIVSRALQCIPLGKRVRVTLADSTRVRGNLLLVDSTSARVANQLVPLTDISAISVQRRHAKRGAVIGGIVGAVGLGVMGGIFAQGLCDYGCGGAFGEGLGLGVAVGLPIGVGLGALTGYFVQTWPTVWER